MDLKSRLNSVISKDKENNPKYLKQVIKSDFFYLISNYFEVDFEDIDVDIHISTDNQYLIELVCRGDRIKLMRSIV